MEKLTLYGTPISLPEISEGESFFSKSLNASVGIYQEAGLWDLLARRKEAKKPGFPNRLYPSSSFLRGVLRSLTYKKVQTILPTDIFFDLMNHAASEGKDVLFITSDPASHREFKRQIGRMIPELPAHSFLESYLTNERPDDMLSLIKKLAPQYIYLGDDIKHRQAWTARLLDQVPGIKLIVLGSGEFLFFAGNRPSDENHTGLLNEVWQRLKKRPLQFFILPFYLLFFFDFFRLKWFHRLKLEPLT